MTEEQKNQNAIPDAERDMTLDADTAPDTRTADKELQGDFSRSENPGDEQKETASAAEPETADESVAVEAGDETLPPKKEKGLRAWWSRHKPSRRRFIQIYSFLLYNAYIKGFITGDIFKGITKTACVPGLNCYSCPGAVAACPLGALQNALTGTGHGSAYFMIGILLLYGLIFGRTICGFLCPMGLGQDLLYKVRTPKLKKNRVTRIFSYLKYVILAVLVIGIPTVYAIDRTAVPGFCKYICPAGTLEGAFMLLVNPSNDSLYQMLGALFSWKTAVLICVFTASIFIYRFFCRFLCPLGAIYGLFNKFALLGIKVDKSKCTDCGKCVAKCKMDIKKVGDHECINCGECIDVCPTKAIVWKGGKVFMNNVEQSLVRPVEPVPADAPLVTANADVAEAQNAEVKAAADGRASCNAGHFENAEAAATGVAAARQKTVRGRAFWLRVICIALAAVLFIGVFTYVNFFAAADGETVSATYQIEVGNRGDSKIVSFVIGDGDVGVVPKSGSGTESDPYIIGSVSGRYDIPVSGDGRVYFLYTTGTAREYKVVGGDDLDLRVAYVVSGKKYSLYNYAVDGDTLKLDLSEPEGYGNAIGDLAYDFTLDGYGTGAEDVTLSEYRGKVTVVNFWGTWCGPCVKELPDFETVRSSRDFVEVIAIHSAGTPDAEVEEFLTEKGWDKWGVIFAKDRGTSQSSEIYKLFGGSNNNTYPRTVVVDANGVITAVFEGSLTQEALANAVDAAK